jgi:hypothetical protein
MDDEPERKRSPSASSLSKTPSWIMLGFVTGAAFVWLLPRAEKPVAPLPAIVARPAEPAAGETTLTAIRTLTTIEAVFEEWGRYAVWDGDTTEVALDPGTGQFSDFYEVKRVGEAFYFRSIPRLTHRELRHGKTLPGSPLRFTETEAQYQEWLRDGRTEHPPTPELNPLPRKPVEPPATEGRAAKPVLPPLDQTQGQVREAAATAGGTGLTPRDGKPE